MVKKIKQKLAAVLFLASIFGAHRASAVELTPLMKAIVSHKNIEAFKLIGECTPDQINWRNAQQMSALDYAVVGGDIEIAAALIEKNASSLMVISRKR